ncbi:MAG: hypothetical protein N3G19_00360 [Candidatus Pacearchaeota archaeon]|nr:hypothetical protein [Candidatus Pacearchaeota archaeon]
MNKNKKGATVQSMLIGIIIVLLTAAILFFFFKALPYKETVDKEACRNSVVLRNNAILKGEGLALEIIPLNCKTQEIIISSNNEAFIQREIANAMYDCWWMLGEGKMDFFPESGWKDLGVPGLGTSKANCIICSTIKFDDNAKGKRIDLLNYLENTKIPMKNITYLEYFSEEPGAKLPVELKIEKLDTNKNYAIIFMGISGAEVKRAILATVGMSSGGAFLSGKALTMISKIGIKGAGKMIPIVGWIWIAIETVGHLATLWSDAHASAVHCDGATGGCFALILTTLEATKIAAECQNIESIP